MASKRNPKTLIAIGGHEDKEQDRLILRCVAETLPRKKLVIATLASDVADEMWQQYRGLFRKLGVTELVHLSIGSREEVHNNQKMQDLLANAGGVFFTGGDQLRITSKLGGTALCQQIQDLYAAGAVMAGTSAGASILTETMIVSGPERSHRIGDSLRMAPGLGFLRDVLIDQHFAERGRIARLVGIVAQNPRVLGLGIDEDTAVIMRDEKEFEVIGSGAVYALDARTMVYTNISEQDTDKTLSAFGTVLHVLSHGDRFDLEQRKPVPAQVPEKQEEHVAAE
jgi:cyanophycinase